MPVTKPTAFVLEHAPWSISKIGVAAQCPHRFYQQYIVKRKMGLPVGSEALIGRAVHSILEDIFKGHKLANAKRMAVSQHKLTTKEIEGVDLFEPAIRKFWQVFHTYKKQHRVQQVTTEKQWAVDFEGKKIGYWAKKGVFIRGAIDLSGRFSDRPYALLLDHKTGKWKELSAYEWQFATYKLLLKAHQPDIQKVQTGINHLFAETVDMSKGLDDVRDISVLLDRLIRYANEQTRATYNHNITRKGPLCGWCDYKSICPAHTERHGKAKC